MFNESAEMTNEQLRIDLLNAEVRSAHLASALRAQRSVTHLLLSEKSRDRLIEGVCRALVESRGYHNAWIALFDEQMNVPLTAQAGLAESFESVQDLLAEGKLVSCAQTALKSNRAVLIGDPVTDCMDCPLAPKYGDRGGIAVRLSYGYRVYGLLVASLPHRFLDEADERSLFEEVAMDVSLAVHQIELAREKETAEAKARLQEEQLRQAGKLATIGTLVAGVSHEINNPNHFIALNTPVLEELFLVARPQLEERFKSEGDFPVGRMMYSEIRENVEDLFGGIKDGARRIKRIVDELREFSRHEPSTQFNEGVDVRKVIDSSRALLGSQIRKTAKSFSVNVDENVPLITANAQRLEQVFINLIQNSCQAIKDCNGAVEVNVACDKDGEQVVITVRDEGEGIPVDLIEQIYDPFFTTKRDSGGTGLGLSIAMGIVRDHNGTLRFSSSEGKGTTAVLTLPVERALSDDCGEAKL